jgi:hypothetical protein
MIRFVFVSRFLVAVFFLVVSPSVLALFPPQILKEIGLSKVDYSTFRKKGQENSRDCVICYDNQSTHVVIPCFHLCLCEDCAKVYKGKTDCPKCRQTIKEIKKTF